MPFNGLFVCLCFIPPFQKATARTPTKSPWALLDVYVALEANGIGADRAVYCRRRVHPYTRYLNGVINIPCLHLLDGTFQQSFSLMCKALELERERCVLVGSEGFIWIGGKVSVLLQREV